MPLSQFAGMARRRSTAVSMVRELRSRADYERTLAVRNPSFGPDRRLTAGLLDAAADLIVKNYNARVR